MISPFFVLRASTAAFKWGRRLARYERVLRGILALYALLCLGFAVLGIVGRPPLGWVGAILLFLCALGYAVWAVWEDPRMESGGMVAWGVAAGVPMVGIVWWVTFEIADALAASAMNGGDGAALTLFFAALAACFTLASAALSTVMVVSFGSYRARVRLSERRDGKEIQRRQDRSAD